MNRHINSFNTIKDFSDKYSKIRTPYVTYIKNTGEVILKDEYHPATEDKHEAHIGDLVFYNDMIHTSDITGDTVLYMDPKDPRVHMMLANDPCLGIVVSLPDYDSDDKIRIVSLDYMDYNNPSGGSIKSVNMMWGDSSTTVTDLSSKNQIIAYTPGTTTLALTSNSFFCTDYFSIVSYKALLDVKSFYDHDAGSSTMVPSPYNAFGLKNSNYFYNSDSILNDGLCGSTNTTKIIAVSSAQVGASSYSNSEAVYPAAMCCASYNSSNLSDWGLDTSYYLPSIAELGLLAARLEEINFARIAAGRSLIVNMFLWSSSLYSSIGAWSLNLYTTGSLGYSEGKLKSNNVSVLAFVAL